MSEPRPKLSTGLGIATLAAALLGAGCGGQAEPSLDRESAALTTTTNFILVAIDANTTPPLLTCTTSTSTTAVNGGTLAVTGTAYTATFVGRVTQGGTTTTQTYKEKGTVTVSGSTYTIQVPGIGSFTGTLSNGRLTISGYPYCGTTHTLVYQQQ